MNNVDINKIVISNKESYGKTGSFKYFIGNDDNDYIKPLCIIFLKWLDMLHTLMVIKICLLWIMIKNCHKRIIKYGNRLAV